MAFVWVNCLCSPLWYVYLCLSRLFRVLNVLLQMLQTCVTPSICVSTWHIMCLLIFITFWHTLQTYSVCPRLLFLDIICSTRTSSSKYYVLKDISIQMKFSETTYLQWSDIERQSYWLQLRGVSGNFPAKSCYPLGLLQVWVWEDSKPLSLFFLLFSFLSFLSFLARQTKWEEKTAFGWNKRANKLSALLCFGGVPFGFLGGGTLLLRTSAQINMLEYMWATTLISCIIESMKVFLRKIHSFEFKFQILII